jgi:ssDNA-binding Zn-finger/Zn-ribbon topoisomerase 1
MSEFNKCDVCGKESAKVLAGRWLFYCSDNKECKQKEVNKIYDNELAPSLEDGQMPDYEVLEQFI